MRAILAGGSWHGRELDIDGECPAISVPEKPPLVGLKPSDVDLNAPLAVGTYRRIGTTYSGRTIYWFEGTR